LPGWRPWFTARDDDLLERRPRGPLAIPGTFTARLTVADTPYSAAPTQQSHAVFDELSKQLEAALAQWRQILNTYVPALNALTRKSNLPMIFLTPGTE
jgi:hypothetical protein